VSSLSLLFLFSQFCRLLYPKSLPQTSSRSHQHRKKFHQVTRLQSYSSLENWIVEAQMACLAHSPLLGQIAQKLTNPLEQPFFYQTRSHFRLQSITLYVNPWALKFGIKWVCQHSQRLQRCPELQGLLSMTLNLLFDQI
jgi:hypothetical protein